MGGMNPDTPVPSKVPDVRDVPLGEAFQRVVPEPAAQAAPGAKFGSAI
jgi:hypothetical protein